MTDGPGIRLAKRAVLACAPALAFVIVTLAVPGLRAGLFTSFERDFDEGGNLMKAHLVASGASLYNEVWSDQPPLFTFLLALLEHVFRPSVVAARVVVLAFACALLIAGARIVARHAGVAGGWLAAALVALSPQFVALSTSVLIGLPAVSLAVCAYDVATTRRESVRVDVAAAAFSGVLLALGCAVKLFVAPLAPVLAAVLVAEGRKKSAAALSIAALATIAAGALFVGDVGARLLFLPHLHARGAALGLSILHALAPALPFVAAAVLLAVVVVRHPSPRGRRDDAALLGLVAWSLVDAVLLCLHKPRWSHHVVIVSVPAALCAGAVLVRAFSIDRKRRLDPSRGAPAPRGPIARTHIIRALAGAAIVACVLEPLLARAKEDPIAASDVVADVIDHGARTLLTDRPMVAYRAGARIPPALAVVSAKRASFDDVDGVFEFYFEESNPDAVYLARFPMPKLARALAAHGYARAPSSTGELWFRPVP